MDDAEICQIKYYSLHQCVIRPESTSTKLHVVFDYNAKISSGLSLNEVMLQGLKMQHDLLSIVLCFRCYKCTLIADVTKMYRRMWVTEDDMRIFEGKAITKRTVLAELSTLFDPLGLIIPVIVKAKIFMQDLWN